VLIRTPRDLGAVIRERRRELRWDQQTLANKIGTSRQWVIEIEKGKARAEVGLVLRALDALGVSLSLSGGTATSEKAGGTASEIDIDAIVRKARGDR
jgi:y4mF family transcriptional regulator